MKKIIASYFFLGFALFFSTSLYGLVVIVHGTFAQKDMWHQKGGDFYKAYAEVNPTDTLYSFTWSGKLSAEEHLKAAKDLCAFIIRRPYDEEKIFIGHSHGGSIINLASHLLDTAQYAIKEEYQSVNEKLDNLLKIFTSNSYYLHEDFPYSYTRKLDDEKRSIHEVSVMKELLFDQLSASVEQLSGILLEVNKGMRFVKKRYVMHRVQLLATPILVGNYYPNMSIIQRAEHYYSQGDWIQKVGGQMKHEYPFHARLSQIELSFVPYVGSKTVVAPDHSGLHHPIVARWLADRATIDTTIFLGKHYQLILSLSRGKEVCREKDLSKK